MAVTAGRADALSRDQLEQFERDGYFVVDGACPDELVEGVRAEIEPLLHDSFDAAPTAERDGLMYAKHGGWADKGYAWHRVTNAWKKCDNVRSLALLDPILGITEQLYDRAVKPFQTLNFPVGTEQPAHADSFHFQSDPPGYMCGIWVALEDMDMDNGPLVYYPGSHKLPMPTWEVIEAATGQALRPEEFDTHQEYVRARHAQYARYCVSLVEEKGLEPHYATIRKGQALIWAANLLHGGSPQKDRTRTRHSQVTHYFFEGCRIYTPMHVEQGHVYWDYPEWIHDPVPEYSASAVHEVVREHVPAGAHVLIVARGDAELLDLDGYRVEPYPQDEDGSEAANVDDAHSVELLETLRGRGARFLVVPKPSLSWLEWGQPSLQEQLESRHRGVHRDGATCAIYSLE